MLELEVTNPMMILALLVLAMNHIFHKILHLVMMIVLKTIWVKSLMLINWKLRLCIKGNAHQAAVVYQKLLIHLLKERGMSFNNTRIFPIEAISL